MSGNDEKKLSYFKLDEDQLRNIKKLTDRHLQYFKIEAIVKVGELLWLKIHQKQQHEKITASPTL